MKRDLEKYDFLEDLEDDVEFILEEQKIAILEEIILIMEKYKISRAELARRLKTSRAYVTKMFRANVNFTLKSLVHIAQALETKISFHLYHPAARTFWFDLYDTPREKEVKLLTYDFDLPEVEVPKKEKDAAITTAA